MAAIATLITYAVHTLRPVSPFAFLGIDLLLLIALVAARGYFGATPEEFLLNYAFGNRVIGILMALVGTVLGIQVGKSFSNKRWTASPVGEGGAK